jgi:hypothetical protein
LEVAIREELWPWVCNGLRHLVFPIDNGCQYLSRPFFEYIRKSRNFAVIQHELTGHDQPEGDAHVERTIPAVKEREVCFNEYEGFFEARGGVSVTSDSITRKGSALPWDT